eukprot:6263802-Alexandrium_andersonii.AAC.1
MAAGGSDGAASPRGPGSPPRGGGWPRAPPTGAGERRALPSGRGLRGRGARRPRRRRESCGTLPRLARCPGA